MKNQIFKCRICESEETNDWVFKEMMFGLKDEFKYKECISCGCIQIENYPKSIENYYPPNYYSFNNNSGIRKGKLEQAKTAVLLYNHLVFNDALGKVGKKTYPPLDADLNYLNRINLKPWSKILDIGCGNGNFLVQLYHKGFSDLTGIDKYISKQLFLFNRIHIWKKEITELETKFDVITMHHVLEHMPNQSEILKSIHSVLKNKGNLVIRIPIVNTAWKIYRENWVQLDAPRHYYIHSIESFKLLAKKSGFMLTDVVFDSYALQFWGSEQYRMDIPLRNDNRSYAENIKTTIFTSEQITEWESKSIEFNNNKKGDQVIFYLKKIA